MDKISISQLKYIYLIRKHALINTGINFGISLIVQCYFMIVLLPCINTTWDYWFWSILICSLRLLSNPAVPVMKAGTSEEDRHRALTLARVRALIQFYTENQVVVLISFL